MVGQLALCKRASNITACNVHMHYVKTCQSIRRTHGVYIFYMHKWNVYWICKYHLWAYPEHSKRNTTTYSQNCYRYWMRGSKYINRHRVMRTYCIRTHLIISIEYTCAPRFKNWEHLVQIFQKGLGPSNHSINYYKTRSKQKWLVENILWNNIQSIYLFDPSY